MKLIDILVRELPKRGGWVNGTDQCAQDKTGEICFYTAGAIRMTSYKIWCIPADSNSTHDGASRIFAELSDDYKASIVTRDQYEAALAASNKEWDSEGLPPVGCECEYIPGSLGPGASDDNKPSHPTIIRVVAHEQYPDNGNKVFVGVWIAESGGMRSSVFAPEACAPLRSEADKKRDAAIERMVKVIGITPESAAICYEISFAGGV